MNCLVQWAALRAIFASLSTLMLIPSFSEQLCYFFVSSVCDSTYLNMTQNGWAETRWLKVNSTSAWVWFFGSEPRGAFPWKMTPLLSQSIMTRGVALCYSDAAAFRINCIINPPRISPQYAPADDKRLAHVHLHCTLAILQHIIVTAEQMSGDTFFIFDPSCIITRDGA